MRFSYNLQAVTEAQYDPALSSFACKCGTFLTLTQLQQVQDNNGSAMWSDDAKDVHCSRCDSLLTTLERLAQKVSFDNAHLMDSHDAKKATWYHVTSRANWMNDVLSNTEKLPYVHVGTKEAALDRAYGQYFYGDLGSDKSAESIAKANQQEIYLYEMELVGNTELTDEFAIDDDNWPQYVSERNKRAILGDALRYLNAWEAAGSVSMIVDPRKLTIKSVRRVDANECLMPYLTAQAGKLVSV